MPGGKVGARAGRRGVERIRTLIADRVLEHGVYASLFKGLRRTTLRWWDKFQIPTRL